MVASGIDSENLGSSSCRSMTNHTARRGGKLIDQQLLFITRLGQMKTNICVLGQAQIALMTAAKTPDEKQNCFSLFGLRCVLT